MSVLLWEMYLEYPYDFLHGIFHIGYKNLLKTCRRVCIGFKYEILFLTKFVKTFSLKMYSLGETIRKLREERDLPLRTVAEYLEIDLAILSKIERGQRRATRDLVVKFAKYYNAKEEDLLIAWLSDKLVYELEDEEVALKALQVAEEKVKYITKQKKK